MKLEQFREQAFALALAHGCDAAETYYAAADSFEAQAQGGELDRYAVSHTAGLSLRVQLSGRNGYAYTERLNDPAELVRRAMDNARAVEDEDEHPMQGACGYRSVAQRPDALAAMDEAGKIALVLELERATLRQDARVLRVMDCEIDTLSTRVAIHNTRGLAAEREERTSLCYTMPVAEQDGERKNAYAFRVGDGVLDTEGCAAEAVAETAALFGGAPVPSGTYPVVLRNDAAASLLGAFSSIFSADAAQKGRSLLAGREGEAVAAACVSIVDDPFHPYRPRAFDDEGTPSRAKRVVDGGTLTTLLHNLKTARKAGCESTGNGCRPSAAAPVGVGPTVMYLEPGRETREALLARMGDGLLVTDLEGLHAGLDPVSGDFSLKASGRRIERGADAGAVSQITVAGNFFTLLKQIVAVGDDLKFGLPGAACFGAPSVLVQGLMVAGK